MWYVVGKFIIKVGLLENNPKIKLFITNEWKVGLLMSNFPNFYSKNM